MLKVTFAKHFLGLVLILGVISAKAQTLQFDSTPVETATYDASYVYHIETSGGIGSRSLSISGNLPGGLTFDSNGSNGKGKIAGTPTEVGDFPITLTVTAVLSEETQPFTISVAKAIADVQITNLTTTFNGVGQSITVTTTPANLTVDVTYDGSSSLPVNAGSYAVIATINDPNYQGTATGTFIINKAVVTATAEPKARIYNEADPSFTVSYSGFVNSETAAVLDSPPSAATTATPTSPVGDYEIIVSGGTDDNYDFAYVNGTLTIDKATPQVTWANPSPIVEGTALSATQLNATATDANGATLPGTFTYTPPAGTLLSAGANQSLSVDFVPTDATNYNSVGGTVVQITVTNKTDPVITWNNPSPIVYGTLLSATQLNAIASVPGTFTYTPIAGTLLNAGANQILSVNFVPDDATTYNSVNNKQVQITVTKAAPTVSWSNPAPIIYGTPLSATQLNATASVPGTFTYTPASGDIITVGTNKTLSVNFTPTDAANYTTVNNTQVQITVGKATPTINWANPSTIVYGTPLGASQLNATATNASDGNVPGTFSYAPVSGTILNAGADQALSVNFNPTDAANYNAVPGTQVLITVNKATPVITWATPAPIKVNVPIGATQLNATSNVPGNFTYTPPSGTSFPTDGTYPLSADFTPTDLSNYNTVSNTQVQLIVTLKDTPVITWANPADIVFGTPLSGVQLNATANTAGTFTYTPSAGTVLNAGVNQTLSVEFVPTNTTDFKSVSAQVPITVKKATPVITWANPAAITYGDQLSATQLNASTTESGTFTYTPPIGTILNAGVNQILTMEFTPASANFSTTTKQVQITVNKATPVITWTAPIAITYGTPLSTTQLNATANTPGTGTFTYTPLSGTILNAGANQPLSVNFTPNSSDAINFTSVNGTQQQITVNKATPVITWATPAPIKIGSSISGIQLNATSGGVPGNLSYTPPNGTVFPTEGTFPLSVNFTPTNTTNYNSVNNTQVQLTVSNKENPVITWANPSPINYGTALNSTQLNAITNAIGGGTFSYQPISGIKLNAGVNQLTVLFTPNDPATYNSISKTVSIMVNKGTLNVTAGNATRTYGVDNPVFVLNYTGFVNNETITVIDIIPTATSTATLTSPIGSVPINVSGGSDNNYSFVYTPGSLTITKALLTATANDESRLFNTANPPLTITYSGFVNNESSSVINVLPTVSTTATVSSPGGVYPITVSGGSDDHYNFSYVAGTLTVIVNNPPVLKNFQIVTEEDTPFDLDYTLFSQNITDDADSEISLIKIISVPTNGSLLWKGVKVLPGGEITVESKSLQNFTYQPNTDFNGSDSFSWNAFDGTFLSLNPASVSIKINAVNDAPVLSNIESSPISYNLGDKGVAITQSLTVNDIDNTSIHSAKITIEDNHTAGDLLSIEGTISTKIISSFNSASGELTLTGKDSKANYEAALSKIVFSSVVTESGTISNKNITIIANDSIANSNVVSRAIVITETFPELDFVNAFTPNGDGVNDLWDIGNLNMYSKIKLIIYNQNGARVFTCEDASCNWDGKLKGQELPSGPYFYTINLNEGTRKYQGTVTILK